MNSDRIREMFGSYAVAVLLQQDALRVANLCSRHGDKTVCRTLAVTLFATPEPAELAATHAKIAAGASIGETLRDSGYRTEKHNDYWCRLPAGNHFAELTDHTVQPEETLAVRIYTLRVYTDWQHWDYATIAEAYHPEHSASATAATSCDGDPLPGHQHEQALAVLRRSLQVPPGL